MGKRTEQLNVRITVDTKAEWAEFVEESRQVDGLSDLVRQAVAAYMNAGGDPREMGTTGGDDAVVAALPDDVDERLEDLQYELRDVAQTVDRIDESAGYIERELTESDGSSFSERLMRVIPPAKPETDDWRKKRDKYDDDSGNPVGDPTVWDGTVEAFASALEASAHRVEQSLSASLRYRDDVPLETAVVDGERRYWAERRLDYVPFADGRDAKREAEERAYKHRQEARGR